MGTVKSLLVESYADKSGSAALNEDAANHEIQQIRNSAAVSSAAVSSSMVRGTVMAAVVVVAAVVWCSGGGSCSVV
jgi:hypothetical protein